MKIKVTALGDWKLARKMARNTIGKPDIDKEVSEKFKTDMVMCEHSPIREVGFLVEMVVPTWMAQHFSRHRIGTNDGDYLHEDVSPSDINHYVKTQRNDRTGQERGSQNDLVNYSFTCNVQALINMSKVRLCHKAHKDTVATWKEVVRQIVLLDRMVGAHLVSSCVYRGFCPEIKSCKYNETKSYISKLSYYRNKSKYIDYE